VLPSFDIDKKQILWLISSDEIQKVTVKEISFVHGMGGAMGSRALLRTPRASTSRQNGFSIFSGAGSGSSF
jgi:hypothetical protein